MTPRLERDDDRECDDDEREQEVGHHGERVEVEDHRQAAERNLGDRAEERRERGPADPRREPCDPARGEPRDEGHEDPPQGDDPVSELDDRVEVLRRKGRRAAPWPVVAAEPRAGQPDERAGGDDEPEGDDGRHGELEKPVGRHGPAEPGGHPHARETPVPGADAPDRVERQAGRGEGRLHHSALLRRERDQEPARGLRVVGERLELSWCARRHVTLGELAVPTVAAGAHPRDCELDRARKGRQRLGHELQANAGARGRLVGVPEQPEARHVRDGVRRERAHGVRRVAVGLAHRRRRRLERTVGRDAVAHALEHEPGSERLRQEDDVAGPRRALPPDAVRDAPSRRPRARTSARRRGSCDRRRGSPRPRASPRPRPRAPRRAPRPAAPRGTR